MLILINGTLNMTGSCRQSHILIELDMFTLPLRCLHVAVLYACNCHPSDDHLPLWQRRGPY